MAEQKNAGRLTAGVGRGERNNSTGVLLVQQMLNALVDGACIAVAGRVPETGVFGAHTENALLALEAQHFHGMASPNHSVKPESQLFYFLNHLNTQAGHGAR